MQSPKREIRIRGRIRPEKILGARSCLDTQGMEALASSTLRISLSLHEYFPSCIPLSESRYVGEKSGNLKGSSAIHNIRNKDSNKFPVRMSSNVTKNLSFDFFFMWTCAGSLHTCI